MMSDKRTVREEAEFFLRNYAWGEDSTMFADIDRLAALIEWHRREAVAEYKAGEQRVEALFRYDYMTSPECKAAAEQMAKDIRGRVIDIPQGVSFAKLQNAEPGGISYEDALKMHQQFKTAEEYMVDAATLEKAHEAAKPFLEPLGAFTTSPEWQPMGITYKLECWGGGGSPAADTPVTVEGTPRAD